MHPRTSRRTALRTLGVVLVPGLAGCLSDDAGSPVTDGETADSATQTPDSTTRTAPTTRRPDPTTSSESTETYVPGWENPEPEKDHDVILENRHGEPHTIDVRITHEQRMIFEESFDAEPGFDRVIYNFLESPIDGIASYEVRAELEDGTTAETTFATDSCHGQVIVSIGENGELNAFYSIC